jgi:hypothetical protein
VTQQVGSLQRMLERATAGRQEVEAALSTASKQLDRMQADIEVVDS